MRMNPAANCIYLFLQVVLAPILYPYGYLIQIIGLLILGLQNKTLQERERHLLDPLLLIMLVSNIILSGELTVAHYAVRLAGVLLLCCGSSRLQDLSVQLMDPFVSMFMLVELLLSPHLYPNGYFAQLGLYLFFYWTTNPKAVKHLPPPPPSAEEEIFVCKICYANSVATCFSECGHCVCRSCASAICSKKSNQRCPFCNAAVTKKIDLYMP